MEMEIEIEIENVNWKLNAVKSFCFFLERTLNTLGDESSNFEELRPFWVAAAAAYPFGVSLATPVTLGSPESPSESPRL